MDPPAWVRSEHAHHRKPRKSHPDLVFVTSNIAALCESCHSIVEAEERRAKQLKNRAEA
jgi:5-methylcytosine-specific restriction endonuclease McrA